MDLNAEKYDRPEGLSLILNRYLSIYESIYGADSREISPSDRFYGIIRRAYEQTGKQGLSS